jgi:transposase
MDEHGAQDLSRTELLALVMQLRAENAALKVRLTALETELAKARKNSRNSSKPPSSDIVKPPPAGPVSGHRHIGAQPGHERHERAPFSPKEVDDHKDHKPRACPDCGGSVRCAAEPSLVVQQVELVAKPYEVVEHRAWDGQCTCCGRKIYAALPPEVEEAGLFGPHLTAHVAWLKLRGHVSYSGIQEYLEDVFGLHVSCGYLDKVFQKAATALRPVWTELHGALRDQPVLNADETSHPEAGKRRWTWVFRAAFFTVFRIAPSRGSEILVRTLGKSFAGILCADYFSAYRKYMGENNVQVQFCMAHFIRDARFLAELADPVTRRYGQKVVRRLRHLFRVIHWRERYASPATFQRALERARDRLRETVLRAPARREAQNLAERFRKHGEAYLLFVTTPGLEPTNNLAEQALRFVVLDRRITQGTRSAKGSTARETLWTIAATCRQQGRSLYRYLVEAISAHYAQRLAPSLLPAGP